MLQSRLFSYVMAGSVSEGDWVHSATQAKRPFYVVYFSRLYFLNRSRKNTSWGEFTSCEIITGKSLFTS